METKDNSITIKKIDSSYKMEERVKQDTLYYLRVVMSMLNLLILLFLSIIAYWTVYQVVENYTARKYLDSITYLPRKPIYNMIILMISFFILLLIIEYRDTVKAESEQSLLLGIVEIILCLIILNYENVAYSGILFLFTADIVKSIKNERQQWLFFGLMSVIYVLSDYNVLSLGIKMIAFSEYLTIYEPKTRMILMGTKNMLVSLNTIVFILYVIILMRNQRREKKRVLDLNIKLNEANEQLKIANEQLKDHAKMQRELGEVEERNRIAREIHDTLGHTMTGLAVGIEACCTLIDYSAEESKKQMQVLAGVARDGLKDIRRSVNKLRPDMLEKNTLDEALRKMIEDVESLNQVHVTYQPKLDDSILFNTEEEDTIYRIVQESITNAIRHGGADEIFVTMYREDSDFVIKIEDNGVGCNHVSKGFGLIHMEERLHMIHGTVSYDGSNGFLLLAKIPLRTNVN